MIRLLIVDDHPVVKEGLVSRFGAVDGFTVAASATTLRDALSLAEKNRVDIALVDVQLDTLADPAAITTLSARCRVVLFSARRGDDYVQTLLDAGASCFLDKAAPLEQLDATLRAVHAGERPAPTPVRSGARALLSPREYEVYRALATRQSPKAIAAHLGLAASTVYCHLENARRKLGLGTTQELVAHVLTQRDS